MAYSLGIVLFALAILFAVCLHEAGHMGTAKAFGMKVTRYFVGFGPTLWSFRRGDTEYGVKAIPLGGFVKIVGMTPQDDDVEPGDEARAMWRFPVWKRTIVMSAGSITHFILAFVAFWAMFVLVGIPDVDKLDASPAKVGSVASCVTTKFEIDPATRAPRPCGEGDPRSPAAQAGLRPGDVITGLNGESVPTYREMRTRVRTLADSDVTLTYTRDGETRTANVRVHGVERVKEGVQAQTWAEVKPTDIERTGMLGVGGVVPLSTVGPIAGVGETGKQMGRAVTLTLQSLKKIPEKVPALVRAITGEQRDPETPVSVVGASRIGGELVEMGDWTSLLSLFAVLNLFFGLFNLLPLLPMDGGHIAIAWFERIRSWVYARFGKRDPGRVDYLKLTPITLVVIAIMGVFVLLTVSADVINPITLK
ncbi:MAG TPA: site-2 protease family protein [Micromonosporaceae bacterium]|nr:site-2 protease family protein [Micromonosporaceae bacterium]